jgi:epoxyqueuosine reductase
MELAEALRSIAQEKGLAGYGVCRADPFREAARSIAAATATGRSAGLHFTFTEPAATDITVTFPWAQRLVVGAWSYLERAGLPGPPRAGSGRVARFATHDHYEDLRRGLDGIAAALTSAGHRAEILIDDNRLVDRAAAVRAGVGWWGKNTMVLAPGLGPWMLLGSVVTDALLDITQPMARDCGTCDACLPACPTGALVEPGVLDARLCLAYWAQAPGSIPIELRTPMGDRIYGCDDCLEACPPGIRLLHSVPALGAGRHDLPRLLGADATSLLTEFSHFYVPKRNARYLRRNALVALGNVGGPGAVAIAAGYLGHPDPLLRGHAAWALGSLGGPMARAALGLAAATERDAGVTTEISQGLARC